MTITALIERLEKATGPDRAIDGEIWRTVNHDEWEMRCWFKGKIYAGQRHSEVEKAQHAKRLAEHFSPIYTASIDTALTLVPNDFPIEKLSWWPKTPAEHQDQRVCHVTLLEIDAEGWGARRRFNSVGATPAIALCIAALKARQVQP